MFFWNSLAFLMIQQMLAIYLTDSQTQVIHCYLSALYIHSSVYRVGLVYFSSLVTCHNKTLKQWTKRCRTTDKLQLIQVKHTDLLLVQLIKGVLLILPGKPSWLPCFILPVFSFWLCLSQSRACTHHQSMKGNTNGHMLNANWQLYVV